MKLLDLINSKNTIDKLANEDMRAVVAYRIAKDIKIINSELVAFEDARKKLINKYAKKDEKGEPLVEDNNYLLDDESSFKSEYMELVNSEGEIEGLAKIKIEDLENVKLTPLEMTQIEFLIDE